MTLSTLSSLTQTNYWLYMDFEEIVYVFLNDEKNIEYVTRDFDDAEEHKFLLSCSQTNDSESAANGDNCKYFVIDIAGKYGEDDVDVDGEVFDASKIRSAIVDSSFDTDDQFDSDDY